jgi:two-component system response regulator BaeR
MSEPAAGPAAAYVLVIEDEPKIARLLEEYLQAHGGFRTHVLHRGDEVLASCRDDPPDLVLLDLMLPGLDGIEICKQLRAESPVPIVMVTARVDEIDRLLGLELGADDYICKPFSPREVVARVKAVLRRTMSAQQNPTADSLLIDRERFLATMDGQRLDLTPVEFALLETLHAKPGRVFSREQLMDRMYADYRVVGDRAVDTHVKNLRRKLAAAAPGRELIESVYGLGYRYTP